jgi:hypothetical protein
MMPLALPVYPVSQNKFLSGTYITLDRWQHFPNIYMQFSSETIPALVFG